MSKHKVYVDGKVHVRRRRCDTCIFGSNSPVSVARREEMVDLALEKNGCIPCHHHLHRGEPVNPVCNGFYSLHESIPLRLAAALEVIEWT